MMFRVIALAVLFSLSIGTLRAEEPSPTGGLLVRGSLGWQGPASSFSVLNNPAVPAAAQPLWRVRFTRAAEDGPTTEDVDSSAETTLAGRVLVEAADGGILLEDRTGRLWNLTPDRLISRERTGEPFQHFDADELADALARELGGQFRMVRTRHYLIATSGDREYAQWCAALFERLLRAFLRYWQAAGLDVSPPSAPLPVIVHGTREKYAAAVREEGGDSLAGAHGYYSMRTNRVVLVSGGRESLKSEGRKSEGRRSERQRSEGRSRGNSDLRPPISAAQISTMVHEATHQIAFNCGLHRRYADNPVWLTEGMAMFFEVPDLSGGTGWRTIGRVNRPRLNQFRRLMSDPAASGGRQPSDGPDLSLTSLIADDERFRNAETIEAAYAQAWALTYYLIKTRRRDYVSFLKKCSENSQLVWKTRKGRVDEFERAFGESPHAMQEGFLRYVRRMR